MKKAADEAWKKLRPTISQVTEAVEKKSREEMTRKKPEVDKVSAESLYSAKCEEEEIVMDMVTQWSQGGHGYVPQEKPDDVLRLSVENANSLSIYHPTNWKLKKLCAINNRYNTDGALLVETGANWAQAPDTKKPQALFRGQRKCRVSPGHNVHESGPEYG